MHINTAFGIPLVEGDSFFTIGCLWSNGTPFANNLLDETGIAPAQWSAWEADGDLFIDNGSWFVPPTAPQGEPIDGRVLVAQLTNFPGDLGGWGDVTFTAGFRGTDANGDVWEDYQEFFLTIPGPGGLILAVCVLAPYRRRRKRV